MAYTSSQVVQAVPTGINSALVFISSGTLTSAVENKITNCFSSSYSSYKVIFYDISVDGAGASALNCRLGTSGTTDTGSNYNNAQSLIVASPTGIGNENINRWIIHANTESGRYCSIEVIRPFETTNTFFNSFAFAIAQSVSNGTTSMGFLNTSTSYTDISLLPTIPNVRNISCKYYVYGYTNS
jgi:hypothetical protein